MSEAAGNYTHEYLGSSYRVGSRYIANVPVPRYITSVAVAILATPHPMLPTFVIRYAAAIGTISATAEMAVA